MNNLTPGDVVILLHDLARSWNTDNPELALTLRDCADQISQVLSNHYDIRVKSAG